MQAVAAALSLSSQIEKYGAYAGIAAVVGLGLLAVLYAAQAREVKRLREWAGRAPERDADLQQRVVAEAQRRTAAPARPAPAQTPATPAAQAAKAAQQGAVPAAAPAGAATPAGAVKPATPGAAPAVAPAAAAAAAAAAAGAAAAKPGEPPAAPVQPGAKPAVPAAGGQPTTVQPAASGAAAPAKPAAPATPGATPAASPATPSSPATPTPAAPAGQTPATAPSAPATPPASTPAAARPAAAAAAAGAARPAAGSPTPAPSAARPRAAAPAARPRAEATVPPSSGTPAGSRRGLIGVIVGGIVIVGIAILLITQVFGGSDNSTPTKPNSIGGTSTSTGGGSTSTTTTPAAGVDKSTQVAVLNGTTVTGLARAAADKLTAAGYKQVGPVTTDTSNQQRPATVIFYEPSARREALDAAKLVGVGRGAIQAMDQHARVLGGLYLARHGQTAYNLQRRFQGRLPVPLDETGRAQAAVLAEAVADVAPATLVCSGLARAQETAGIVAARVGLEPVVDPRFDETDAGNWTDRPFAEVIAEDPKGFERFVALDPDWAFPGGESFAAQTERVLAGVADWRARADDAGPVVVVCHGVTIRLAMVALQGTDPLRPDNGSLVAL